MADIILPAYGLCVDIGRSTDTADRLARSTTKKLWPIDEGGFSFQGSPEVQDVPTLHCGKGSAYSYLAKRNAQRQTLAGPLFPALVSTLLHAPGTAPGFIGTPPFNQVVMRLIRDLGVNESGNARSHLGSDFLGCIFDGFSLTADKNAGTPIAINLGGFLNADRAAKGAETTTSDTETAGASKVITVASAANLNVGDFVKIGTTDKTQITAVSGNDITVANLSAGISGTTTVTKVNPDPSRPVLNPYSATNAFVDFAIDLGAWSGNKNALQSINFDYQGNFTPEGFSASTDDALNQTWTQIAEGVPSCTGQLVLALAQDAFLDYTRSNEVRKARLRFMAYSPSCSYKSTTTAGVTAGTNVTISVAATSGCAVNDYVLLDDGNRQCVGKVTAISAGVSITVDNIDVNLNSGAAVRNTAFQVKFPRLDITAAPLQRADTKFTVQIAFAAKVDTNSSSIIEVLGYDDDNA